MCAPIRPTSWERFGKSSAPNRPAAKGQSPHCTRTWTRRVGGAKRPNGSATTYVENYSPSDSNSENPPRRPKNSKGEARSNLRPQACRRVHGDGPGGGGSSRDERVLVHRGGNPGGHRVRWGDYRDSLLVLLRAGGR